MRPAATAALLLALAAPAAVRAEPEDTAKLYQRLLRSAAWIRSDRPNGAATGTGSVINAGKRLILTNYHVVGDTKDAYVVFPLFRDGRLVAERDANMARLKNSPIPGRVIKVDKRADLALIELSRLPAENPQLPLAETGASPGQDVHSIGNPGGSGALWVYTPGKVRQVYHKKWRAELEPGRIANFEAQVVETDSATNPGDSGGPLVNDKGELVGVTQGGAIKASLLSTFVDVSEVKRFLRLNDALPSGSARPSEPEKKAEVKRDPPTVKDEAKFFSAEAVEKANETVAAIFKRTGKVVLVETHQKPPEKLAGKSGPDRDKAFAEWARERLKAEKADGLILLATREPGHLTFQSNIDGKYEISEKDGAEIRKRVLDAFRKRDFDAGLTDGLKGIDEKLGK